MKQLILFRHAKTENGPPNGQDRLRTLTQRGHSDAIGSAQMLVNNNISPNIALLSPATRCLQTWNSVKYMFPNTRAITQDNLYLADSSDLFALAKQQQYDSVMLIAHNPGLHRLALALAPGGHPLTLKLNRKFPTSAIAVFNADTLHDWNAHLVIYRSDT